MNDPIGIQRRMERIYRLYIESSFPLQSQALSDERRALLSKPGVLSQPPLIEPVPAYEGSGRTLQDAVNDLPNKYADLPVLADSLFPNGRELYSHQWQALESSLAGRDVVVTTGTGSGKTEAFLLPLLASLAAEVRTWPAADPSDDARYWWRDPSTRKSQWDGHHRPAAIRALVLYPLNALVEDQLRRLRSVLDRPSTLEWLDGAANGNRITFGRYTGSTPVAGYEDAGRRARLREALRAQDRLRRVRADLIRAGRGDEYNFQDLTGGEVWSRWDCQERPPDILITNYSMLNIMLMRDIEAPMFEKTRDWLAASPDNVLHLVVDELHSYRGTAGTEVSYILRLLLHRLGLRADSEQLRIIATSASISANDAGREFLSEFFGRSPSRFDFVGNTAKRGQALDLRPLAASLAELSESVPESELSAGAAVANPSAVDELLARAAHADPDHYGQISIRDGLAASLLAACRNASGEVRALPAPELASLLFDRPDLDALRGLLMLVAEPSPGSDRALQPVRSHVFFQNIHNLWACTNPSCHPEDRTDRPNVGRLFSEHHLTCPDCGSRVLEIIVCEVCGEILLGGARYQARGSGQTEVLSSDNVDLERVPDQLSSDRHSNYAIVWPVENHAESDLEDKSYSRKGVQSHWTTSFLIKQTGELTEDKSAALALGAVPVWRYSVKQGGDAAAFPPICPSCSTDYSYRDVLPTPLRRHGTGVQRSAQVLAGALLRELDETSRKIVVFSDSRQDAARLSAGIEQDHFRDTVRTAALRTVREIAGNIEGAVRCAVPGGDEGKQMLAVLAAINPSLAEAASSQKQDSDVLAQERFKQAFPSEFKSLRLLALGDEADESLITLLKKYPNRSTLAEICEQVFYQLASIGICPGGTTKKALFFQDSEEGPEKNWDEAFDWSSAQPRPKPGIGPSEYIGRAKRLLRSEIFHAFFTHRARTVESAGLAYVAAPLNGSTGSEQQAANAIARLLGVRRRYEGSVYVRSGDKRELSAKARAYLKAAGVDSDDLVDRMFALGHLEPGDSGPTLRLDALEVVLCGPDAPRYGCDKCSATYLHPSAGYCVHCSGGKVAPLESERVTTASDYYAYLTNEGAQLFRMNSQELTGQTDADDRVIRQRQFQDVFLEGENPRAQGVDLLSVTTTMEAGVDIGALNAVMMGNMPPRRFNYQQRVGRAGRRGAGLSLAVTLCRGRTHDSYYYQNPKAITGDAPPQPHIDTASLPIFERVLRKEVLRRAFTGRGAPGGDLSDPSVESVHGSFGHASDWLDPKSPLRQRLVEYLASDGNVQEVRALGGELAAYTRLNSDSVDSAVASLHELPQQISSIAEDPSLSHTEISERLANRGLLPMFGFPTRTRRLYLSGLYPEWPPRNVVDRDLNQAISSFAPGATLVRDKQVYTAEGVVGIKPKGNGHTDTEPGLFPPIDEINPAPLSICGSCHSVLEHQDLAGRVGDLNARCHVCGHDSVRVIDAREPRDFFVLAKAKDYGGFFEFRGTSTRPLLAVPNPGSTATVGNSVVLGGNNTVLSFNDDNGSGGFDFMHSRQRPDAYLVSTGNAATGAKGKRIALLARRSTDTLQVGVKSWPVAHGAQPESAEGRAAWYSLAFALRNGAARMLDIESNELECGLYVTSRDGAAEGQAFLCDSLENGAGYATYCADSDRFADLLNTLQSTVIPMWQQHAEACDSSCALCMRDYDNLPYHPLLDWRLAADMVQLLAGTAKSLELVDSSWSPLIADPNARTHRSLEQLGFERLSEVTNLPVFRKLERDRTRALIIRHPLWTDDHPQIAKTQRELQELGVEELMGSASPYTLLRRPTSVLSM